MSAYHTTDLIDLFAYILLSMGLDAFLPSFGFSLFETDPVYDVARGHQEEHTGDVHVDQLFKAA